MFLLIPAVTAHWGVNYGERKNHLSYQQLINSLN